MMAQYGQGMVRPGAWSVGTRLVRQDEPPKTLVTWSAATSANVTIDGPLIWRRGGVPEAWFENSWALPVRQGRR